MTELSLPRAGLAELLRGWTGDGELIQALAAVEHDFAWSIADIRQRSRLLTLKRLEQDLQQLPSTAEHWLRLLPVVTESSRGVSDSARGDVRWGETARRFGWPPSRFAVRHRRHARDETALTVLSWMSKELSNYLDGVASSAPILWKTLRGPIETLTTVVEQLGEVTPLKPDRLDLLSLGASANPWPLVSKISAELLRCTGNPMHTAFELLEPDPEMRSRLFHLCVLGEVIRSLRSCGGTVKWLAPVGGSRPGPRAVVVDAFGKRWDLWFEGAAMRAHYALPAAAYSEAVANITGVGAPIGADVVLVAEGNAALLLECKWSANANYVARDGFHQAVSYAFDARHGIANSVWSFIVGPEEVVPQTSRSASFLHPSDVVVGSTSVPVLEALVEEFLLAHS